MRFNQVSIVVALALLVASWVFVLGLDRRQAVSFFSDETARRAWTFILSLVVLILIVDWWSGAVRKRVGV